MIPCRASSHDHAASSALLLLYSIVIDNHKSGSFWFLSRVFKTLSPLSLSLWVSRVTAIHKGYRVYVPYWYIYISIFYGVFSRHCVLWEEKVARVIDYYYCDLNTSRSFAEYNNSRERERPPPRESSNKQFQINSKWIHSLEQHPHKVQAETRHCRGMTLNTGIISIEFRRIKEGEKIYFIARWRRVESSATDFFFLSLYIPLKYLPKTVYL